MPSSFLALLVEVVLTAVAVPDAGAAAAPSSFVADAGVTDEPDGGVPTPTVAEASRPPQLVRFAGRLLAKGTREPLVAASVSAGEDVATETDETGRFALELPAGRHRLRLQQPGYDPVDVVVELVEAAPPPERVFRLAPRLTGERFETVVTPPDRQAPRTSLREEEIRQTPGSLGDPLRVIESLPGVSQVVWPLALYAIRGANPGNTGFFLDGVRLPALYHLALGPSVVHPFLVEQIDFYPGGYPVRYGRYVAGIVAAKTAAPKTDRLRGSVDVRLYDAGGIVTKPINDGKGTVTLAGRFSYTGLIFSLLSPDYTFNYWDYQARVDHVLGPGRLTVFAFGAGDRLGRKSEAGADAELDFHRVDVRWDGQVGGGRLSAGGLVGWDRAGTSIEQLVRYPISVRTLTGAGRIHWARNLGRLVDLELGTDSEWKRFWPESQLPIAQQQDVFQRRTAIAVGSYAGLVLGGGTRLVVSPGLRYDHYFQQGTNRAELQPRLSLRYRAAGDVWLKAVGGRFTQLPSVPVAVPGFEGFGLRTYGPQWSWQGSAGIEAPIGPWLTVDATGFYQRFQLTDIASQFDYDPQQPILELRDGQSYGGEFLIRRPARERLYGWLAYTLSWSERVFPPLNSRGPSDWDQRHILNLVLGYRLDGGWTLGTRFHYNTGRPYPVYNIPPAAVDAPDYVRLPNFAQLDLRVDKRILFDKWTLDVYVELVNTTLSRQVYDVKLTSAGTRDEIAYRIVLPSIGVHAEW